MRGVTWFKTYAIAVLIISTHTPHARRDEHTAEIERLKAISTHTPHARRDSIFLFLSVSFPKFQLTRLMRGVTTATRKKLSRSISFQLTRLMRGVTFCLLKTGLLRLYFNSHASCEA